MQIKERLKLVEPFYGTIGNIPTQKYDIGKVEIDVFIENLGKHDISIDYDLCEKRVVWDGYNGQRSATVPIDANFPNKQIYVLRYLLRQKNLEIDLSNFLDTKSRSDPNVMGGHIRGSRGIVCDVILTADQLDSGLINKIKQAFEETYHR